MRDSNAMLLALALPRLRKGAVVVCEAGLERAKQIAQWAGREDLVFISPQQVPANRPPIIVVDQAQAALVAMAGKPKAAR